VGRWPRAILIGSVIGSCIGCDQVTKVAAYESLAGRESVSFCGGAVRLSYVENPGGFLGFGADLPAQLRLWMFGVVTAFTLALAAHAVSDRRAGFLHAVGVAMIVGGAIGNFVDRASAGVVRDFLNVGIGPVRTGAFNLADLAITAGATAMVLSWRAGRPRPRRPTPG